MRALAADLGWELVTPPKANRCKPCVLNRVAYRARKAIERCFGRIKRLRGIASRYHKLTNVYLIQVHLACIQIMTKQSKRALKALSSWFPLIQKETRPQHFSRGPISMDQSTRHCSPLVGPASQLQAFPIR